MKFMIGPMAANSEFSIIIETIFQISGIRDLRFFEHAVSSESFRMTLSRVHVSFSSVNKSVFSFVIKVCISRLRTY